MSSQSLRLLWVLACVFVASIAAPAGAQHLDVQVQSEAGKLATGFGDYDGGSYTIGARVFDRLFNPSFAINDPGFNAIGTTTGTLPPGSDALPGFTDLYWDFLPMKVDGYASNLLYWDGNGTADDVSFGPAPAETYSLSLFGKDGAQAAADGSDELIPGQIIGTTASDGFLHQHRYFFLDDDTNPNNSTVAVEGVYLIAMRLRMEGIDRSDPFFIVWGTPTPLSTIGTSVDAAVDWVQDNLDQLSPNFSADFDGDLDVDGDDFLTWQRGWGTSGAAALQVVGDADFDNAVGSADLAVWQEQYGSDLSNFVGVTSGLVATATPIPEPDTALMLLLATLAAIPGFTCRSWSGG